MDFYLTRACKFAITMILSCAMALLHEKKFVSIIQMVWWQWTIALASAIVQEEYSVPRSNLVALDFYSMNRLRFVIGARW